MDNEITDKTVKVVPDNHEVIVWDGRQIPYKGQVELSGRWRIDTIGGQKHLYVEVIGDERIEWLSERDIELSFIPIHIKGEVQGRLYESTQNTTRTSNPNTCGACTNCRCSKDN